MVYLAFYKHKRERKGIKNTLFRLFDDITRFFTHGKYSHCELVFKATKDNRYICYTSSNRDGGVRKKVMELPADRWDLVEVKVEYRQIFNFYMKTIGCKYDLCGAIGVVTRFGNNKHRYFCSEWCAEAIELKDPHKYSPNSLYKYIIGKKWQFVVLKFKIINNSLRINGKIRNVVDEANCSTTQVNFKYIQRKTKMQFNKINNPIYTVISNYTLQDDGAISAKYVVGTGEDQDGQIVNFITIAETYKYIGSDKAQELVNAPMTEHDLGKTPQEIMLDRIYKYLKETKEIVI